MQPAYPATGSSIHVVIALEQTMPEDLSYSLVQSLYRDKRVPRPCQNFAVFALGNTCKVLRGEYRYRYRYWYR